MSFIYCRYIGNISAIYMFIQAVWKDTSSDAVDGNILATYIIHTLLIYWQYISNIWSHQLIRQIHLHRQWEWQYSSKTYRLYIGNILAIYQQYKCSHRQFGKIHLERQHDGNIVATYIGYVLLIYWQYISNIYVHTSSLERYILRGGRMAGACTLAAPPCAQSKL